LAQFFKPHLSSFFTVPLETKPSLHEHVVFIDIYIYRYIYVHIEPKSDFPFTVRAWLINISQWQQKQQGAASSTFFFIFVFFSFLPHRLTNHLTQLR